MGASDKVNCRSYYVNRAENPCFTKCYCIKEFATIDHVNMHFYASRALYHSIEFRFLSTSIIGIIACIFAYNTYRHTCISCSEYNSNMCAIEFK